MRKASLAIGTAALVTLALTGCAAEQVPTPAPTPTYQCTPEAGGTPFRCDQMAVVLLSPFAPRAHADDNGEQAPSSTSTTQSARSGAAVDIDITDGWVSGTAQVKSAARSTSGPPKESVTFTAPATRSGDYSETDPIFSARKRWTQDEWWDFVKRIPECAPFGMGNMPEQCRYVQTDPADPDSPPKPSREVTASIARQVTAQLQLPDAAPQVGPDPSLNEWNMAVVGYHLWFWTNRRPHLVHQPHRLRNDVHPDSNPPLHRVRHGRRRQRHLRNHHTVRSWHEARHAVSHLRLHLQEGTRSPSGHLSRHRNHNLGRPMVSPGLLRHPSCPDDKHPAPTGRGTPGGRRPLRQPQDGRTRRRPSATLGPRDRPQPRLRRHRYGTPLRRPQGVDPAG